MSNKPTNAEHRVTIGAPLLRPGITITAVCSEKYVVPVTVNLLSKVREINAALAEPQDNA